MQFWKGCLEVIVASSVCEAGCHQRSSWENFVNSFFSSLSATHIYFLLICQHAGKSFSVLTGT